MEVKTCKNCGRIYNYLGAITPFCPPCMKLLEEKYQICKQYIKDNPGANIQQVSEATECSLKMLKQWVREERLSFAEGSAVGIECESCGANILTGRFCNDCKGRLQQGLQNAYKPKAPEPVQKKTPTSAQMRFLK
ncbi:MAG: flagellar protein [Lachnospiraceae bacterium]|nr:flagellar protein [Lachnospiraceae bacterium]